MDTFDDDRSGHGQPEQLALFVNLDGFEGPIDLLLYFIRRDELDIYDIPISKITKEFVETVEEWEKMHLHIAGAVSYTHLTLPTKRIV